MKNLRRNGINPNIDDPLTAKVIGIAIEIHKELGAGLPESIYHRAMEVDLAKAGLPFVSEAPLVVKYKGHVLGTFSADLVIEECLLVELKALESLPEIAEVQTVSYLKASGIDIGLILNFGTAPLSIKRKFRTAARFDINFRD